jgi:hypothetical protein
MATRGKQRALSTASHLPTDRAFVVQFTASTSLPQQQVTGRVEHVVSGQSTHFQSLEELLAFIAQVFEQKQGKGDA